MEGWRVDWEPKPCYRVGCTRARYGGKLSEAISEDGLETENCLSGWKVEGLNMRPASAGRLEAERFFWQGGGWKLKDVAGIFRGAGENGG